MNFKITPPFFNHSLALAVLAALVTTVSGAPADQNWGQWRGPAQNGLAPHANPPSEWSETKNVRWKFKLPGEGSASPVVWDNLVYVQCAVPVPNKTAARLPFETTPQFAGQQQQQPPGGRGRGFGGDSPKNPFRFTLLAIDRSTGKPAWEKVLREELPHEGHHPSDGTFASASPVADAGGVYAYFGSRGLYALDHQGTVKWQKDLGKARIKMAFGEGSSPALSGNTLVVNWDHEGEDFIVAFDKHTGHELWRQKRDESTSWSTPLIVEMGGKKQVVVNASAKVRSYDLETGEELWSIGPLTANAIPSPVAGNGLIYCMSGFRGAALFAIKSGRTGELAGTDAVAWNYTKDTPYVPSPLLFEDRLYFFKGNEALLSVLDAHSGKPMIEAERLEGIRQVYASPVGAGGRVYVVGREGAALVLRKSDKIEVLHQNKLDDRFDASPALAGNEIYLRGRLNLYCIATVD